LEPALGQEGHLKTARKGVSNYQVVVHGRAAHAGLDPEKGVSSILEMSHIIQQLFALNDPANGISVNVGLVEGGMRSNVIAPVCTAVVDIRTPTLADAERLHTAVHNLQATLSGTSIQLSGGISRPPLERTPPNQALWQQAKACGNQLGLHLQDGMAGGGSDGNTTSRFTATLDGLGPIGDGAHATHEPIVIDKWLERTALLTLLLISPL
jgi:glutamate carboxypeptidase